MRKRRYHPLDPLLSRDKDETTSSSSTLSSLFCTPDLDAYKTCPMPQCHNIVSTSQINISCSDGGIDLSRLAHLLPFTSYDRRRFAAITVRLANPHCTCLLFGSGKLVITGSTSYYACVVASQSITQMLRRAYTLKRFHMSSCVIQNIVAHVEFPRGTVIDLVSIYTRFCECTTYQREVFPGLVLRPPQSPIVLLIFNSGRIVCTGGRSYDDIYSGFAAIYRVLKVYIHEPSSSTSGGTAMVRDLVTAADLNLDAELARWMESEGVDQETADILMPICQRTIPADVITTEIERSKTKRNNKRKRRRCGV